MELPKRFFRERRLSQLVENQTTYGAKEAALHVFETHGEATAVDLRFANPILASMLEGKKIMHLRDLASFEFVPGESVILPSDELMRIDFPEARIDRPTRCLALELSKETIAHTVTNMNERMTKVDGAEWSAPAGNLHFPNDDGVRQIIQRLMYLFAEDHPSKDLFVNNMVQELIVRVLQINSRKKYTEQTASLASTNRMAHVVQYIREHLRHPMTMEDLSNQACMSISNFHKVFKQEFGMSPVDFINRERMDMAIKLLQRPNPNITDVFMACGFTSRSYFNRVFKKTMGRTPTAYIKSLAMAS